MEPRSEVPDSHGRGRKQTKAADVVPSIMFTPETGHRSKARPSHFSKITLVIIIIIILFINLIEPHTTCRGQVVHKHLYSLIQHSNCMR